MWAALRVGQPFSDMLTWHPRDVDTAIRILLDDRRQDEAQRQAQEREQSLAASRQAVFDQLRGKG